MPTSAPTANLKALAMGIVLGLALGHKVKGQNDQMYTKLH